MTPERALAGFDANGSTKAPVGKGPKMLSTVVAILDSIAPLLNAVPWDFFSFLICSKRELIRSSETEQVPKKRSQL